MTNGVGQRILVTGCAGFVGWKVSQKLLERGAYVLGVDSLNDCYDTRLKEWRLETLQKLPNFSFIKEDITRVEALEAIFNSCRFEAVINLAARAGVRESVANPRIYFETNVTGTLNLLESCRTYGVEKFVLASSSSVYAAGGVPFREGDSSDAPLSPYAASKKAAEVLSHSYHYLHGLDVTVLRYFTVYGPAGRPDMAYFKFIQKINDGEPIEVFGDGTQRRDFTYIDDIAEGTLRALQPCGYEIINLGHNQPVELNHVIRLIGEALGKLPSVTYRPKHPADVPDTWADISRAQEILGWNPSVDIEEGLRRTVEWYTGYSKSLERASAPTWIAAAK